MAPLAVMVAPFGMVVGATVAESGVDPVAGLATAPLLYGGSAQLATVGLLATGASAVTVLATVAAVNARLALYGAALAPSLRDQPAWFRWMASYFIVDPQYVVATAGPDATAAAGERRRYYLGAAAVLWAVWHVATVIGFAAGPLVPEGWHLELVVPLYLVAVLAPKVGTEHVLLAVLAAGLAAVALAGLPAGAGLLGGIAAGMAVLAVGREPS